MVCTDSSRETESCYLDQSDLFEASLPTLSKRVVDRSFVLRFTVCCAPTRAETALGVTLTLALPRTNVRWRSCFGVFQDVTSSDDIWIFLQC